MELIPFIQQLIRIPSVTPTGKVCLNFIVDALTPIGYTFSWIEKDGVSNLIADHPNPSGLCFVGHVDVVPVVGQQWTMDPFGGLIKNNILYGRGCVDMKGSIGCFVKALCDDDIMLSSYPSIVLTTDEEGPALNGVCLVAEYFKNQGRKFKLILVGEPTSADVVGDVIKIGRRGSINMTLVIRGKGGHVAYPQSCNNPVNALRFALNRLIAITLDHGCDFFEPSNLEITSIETSSHVTNMIPELITLQINIRYNPSWTEHNLILFLSGLLHRHLGSMVDFTLTHTSNALPFISKHKQVQQDLMRIITNTTKYDVQLSTGGGTSDARFMHHLGPIVELGLRNHYAHQKDEQVPLDDLYMLSNLYRNILFQYFSC